jgi:hypothetical protein
MHPHDNDSLLRVSIVEANLGKEFVKQMLKTVIKQVIENIQHVKGLFDGSRVRERQSGTRASDGGP